jgi:hypothetical protein
MGGQRGSVRLFRRKSVGESPFGGNGETTYAPRKGKGPKGRSRRANPKEGGRRETHDPSAWLGQ